MSGRAKNDGAGAKREAGLMERERSGERSKLVAQISLKGDMLLKLRNALHTLLYTMLKINYQPEF